MPHRLLLGACAWGRCLLALGQVRVLEHALQQVVGDLQHRQQDQQVELMLVSAELACGSQADVRKEVLTLMPKMT